MYINLVWDLRIPKPNYPKEKMTSCSLGHVYGVHVIFCDNRLLTWHDKPICRWQKQWNRPFCLTTVFARMVQVTNPFYHSFFTFPLVICQCHQPSDKTTRDPFAALLQSSRIIITGDKTHVTYDKQNNALTDGPFALGKWRISWGGCEDVSSNWSCNGCLCTRGSDGKLGTGLYRLQWKNTRKPDAFPGNHLLAELKR